MHNIKSIRENPDFYKRKFEDRNLKVNFKDLLCSNQEVTKILSKDEIGSLFDLNKIMTNINKIYKRLGY